jgi:DnaJ-class molecular chaperone
LLYQKCSKCDSTGYFDPNQAPLDDDDTCPNCDGRGFAGHPDAGPCFRCDGQGYLAPLDEKALEEAEKAFDS